MRAAVSQAIRRAIPGTVPLFQQPALPDENAPSDTAPLGLPDTVREALAKCPWIASVNGVSRSLPNRLSLDITFRKPAGVLLWLGERHLVDEDGHWLGPEGALFEMPTEPGNARVPLILDDLLDVRPDSAERGPLSDAWPVRRLAVGARLHQFLLAQGAYEWLPLKEINVTWVERNAGNLRVDGLTQPEVTLVTEAGTQLQWGKTSAYALIPRMSDVPPRDTDEDKLHYLQDHCDTDPGLLLRPGIVNLRVRQPALHPGQ